MHTSVRSLRADLIERLRHGEHLVLYGPRGSGKSTLLADVETRLIRERVPCARSKATRCLNDITCTLEGAYPAVNTSGVTRRAARARLCRAADLRGGVLLLDHLTDVSNAMVGFLRRLHGGVVGVLGAIDVEVERERQRMKPWRLGALSVRMPRTAAPQLRELLRSRCADFDLPPPGRRIEARLLRAARGRPGWILQCAQLQTQGRYWRDERVSVALLCTDTEIALRQGALNLPPAGE
ncbi:MAG: AAA family ATPase [Steroidobacteraceae bacterium]